MNVAEEFKVGAKTVKLVYDEDPESPRTWDNLSTMVCFHKRYELGDKDHGYNDKDYGSWAEVRAAIEKREDPAVILPLYMYDHSGITIRTTPFHCPWDSGQIGWVFVTKKKLREEYKSKRVTKKMIEQATKNVLAEVEAYDDYLTGNVFGFVIEDAEGKELDSCWGFYGLDYAREEAKGAAA